tara:strand:+ start:1194 stop:1469 length:276 start_codon:yes stop_codon:yes gene_type:complete
MDDIKKFENFIINKHSDDKKRREEWTLLKNDGYLPYTKTKNGFELVDIDDYKSDGKYLILKISKVDELNKARLDYISARNNYTRLMESSKK